MWAKVDMLWSVMAQLINSAVTSTGLPYGSAVVKRIAVLARPVLLLNITLSNLEKKKGGENGNNNYNGKGEDSVSQLTKQ